MVRESHRATNNDLAAYMKDVIESAGQNRPEGKKEANLPPVSVVVDRAVPPEQLKRDLTTRLQSVAETIDRS